MKYIFISNIVPDKAAYWNDAFTRAGNNVFNGIIDAFPDDEGSELWSCRPVPSYPKGPIWYGRCNELLENGRKIIILPTLNIKFIKNVYWGICCFFKILKWKKQQNNETCIILTYNLDSPPIRALYLASRICNVKLFAMLYDLGIPPKKLKISKLTRLGYYYSDWVAKRMIKKLDGRIIINELISRDYAPNKDYLLIDGGISQDVVDSLFSLKKSLEGSYTFVLAGLLWEHNGTRLILDTLQEHPELPINVIFAGKGQDVDYIKERSSKDSRIQYVGFLNRPDLFALYERADVLLNLRIEDEIDYHFPSKLLEYLVTGKHVISTTVAHAARDYGKYISFINDNTSDELYREICKVLNLSKQELYEKGIEQRQFMLENRIWSVRAKGILEYIKSKL